MDIFQRSIHSNVKKVDGDHLLVSSSLLDLEHSFHLEIKVRLEDRQIVSAKATMSKTPLSRCSEGTGPIAQLVGERVDRGIIRRINELGGGGRAAAPTWRSF